MKKILVCEDEQVIREFVVINLKRAGYEAYEAENGEQALEIYEREGGDFDVAVLDIMMPGKYDGLAVCKELRKRSGTIGIILLTAKTQEMDKVSGLMMGADDYMTKPFKLAVFLSRINALLRRSENFNQEQAETELQSNGIQIQLLKQKVIKNGTPLDLTASEYKLLCLFMENPNIILSPEQILSKLWDCDEKYIDNNTLTVYIRRLRTKVEDNPADPQKIVTVRRMGYKWNTTG